MFRHLDLNPETILPVDRVPDLKTALEDTDQFKTLPSDVEDTLERFLSRSVSFTRTVKEEEGGLISDLLAEEDVPEWILDILSAIIENFQVKQIENKVENVIEVIKIPLKCFFKNKLIQISKCPTKIQSKNRTTPDCLNAVLHKQVFFD